MTSNKSSAKSAVFSVFRTQLYSMRMVLALFALILLLLPTVVTIGENSRYYNEWSSYGGNTLVSQVQGTIVFLGLLPLLVLAFVLALSEFGYLHKKQKLDYFHALPVRRADHYLGRALAALAVLACGALLICLGQTAAVTPAPGAFETDVFSVIWFSFVMMIFSSFAAYLFTVMIVVLTATLWEAIFSFLAVSAACPLMTAIMFTIVQFSIPLYEIPSHWLVYSALSPFCTGLFGMVGNGRNIEALLPGLLVLFVQILVCGALGFLFFCRRHSELAESTTVCTRFKAVVRFAAAGIAAFVGSMTLLWITNTYAGYLIGALLGAALAWLVLELIYTHSLRRIVKSCVPCLAGLGCFVVVNVLVAFGCIGVPQVPSLNSINAISVSCSAYDETENGESLYYGTGEEVLGGLPVFTAEGERYVETASFDPEIIEKSRALLQAILEDQKETCFPYHPTQWGDKMWSTTTDTAASYSVDMVFFVGENRQGYFYRGWLEQEKGEVLFSQAYAIRTEPQYTQNTLSMQMMDYVGAFSFEENRKGVYQTYDVSLSDLEDRDAVIERIKAAYLEDLTDTAPRRETEEDATCYLWLDQTQEITFRAGIVDGYYPADGMECWLAPQYVPGFDPEKADSYYVDSCLYISRSSLPHTYAVLEEIREAYKG